MHSSFRASKLILSKVGTAASFGFGVNAGARYSDSQSGHRFAIEEARSLSRPEPAPVDVLLGDVLEHADGGGGRGGRDSALMDVQLVDVDRSDLLFGYSTACFSACSGSGRTAAAAVTAVATVASQLSASSSSSTSIREVSSSQQAQKQVMQSLHRDKKQQQQSRQLEGGGREMVERSLAETRAISSSSSRDSHHIVASQNHHHPRHSAAPHKQLHTIHTHEIHQTQPSKHCRDHQKKYLHKLNQQSKQGLPYEHQLQQEFLRPLPFPRLNEEEDLKEEDEKDEKFELKVESVTVAPLVSNDSGEVVTWDSLLENHKCTICSDLLAVPVVTPCEHSYCGICFHDFQQAHTTNHVSSPLACPNCREPLSAAGTSSSPFEALPRDMPRDACIAHQVALFNAQQQQLGEGREDGAYADWVERRVQYFAATTPPHCKQEEEVMEEGSAVELELDDLPSWRRDRETQDMSRNGSSVTAAEASSNGGAVVVLGLAMAVAVVAVAFSSQGREGGSFSSSPPVPQRSVLRELALAVWW